jgi:hypothetical protein
MLIMLFLRSDFINSSNFIMSIWNLLIELITSCHSFINLATIAFLFNNSNFQAKWGLIR